MSSLLINSNELYIFVTAYPKVQDCLPEPETRRATNVASRTHEVGVGAGSSGVLMLAARRASQRVFGPGPHRTSHRKRRSVIAAVDLTRIGLARPAIAALAGNAFSFQFSDLGCAIPEPSTGRTRRPQTRDDHDGKDTSFAAQSGKCAIADKASVTTITVRRMSRSQTILPLVRFV